MNHLISSALLMLLIPFGAFAGSAQAPVPPVGAEWCTGQKLVDIKFRNQRPDKNAESSFYLCVYFNQRGSMDVITLLHGKRYDWTGNYVSESEDGIGAFQTTPILMKTQRLQDGKIAYMYKLQPVIKSGQLVLSYRAGVGLVYDPKTKSFADYATFLVDSEDYYVLDQDYGYYSSAGPSDQKTDREFDGENFETVRLIREFEYQK